MLWHARNSAHKRVYVLASHSHFYMENIFDTPEWKGKVLPGWITGTAGAVRYRLPAAAGPSQKAMTDVYGYLLGTAAPDGSISFAFHKAQPRRPAGGECENTRAAGALVLRGEQKSTAYALSRCASLVAQGDQWINRRRPPRRQVARRHRYG